jgi:hypothetical protein
VILLDQNTTGNRIDGQISFDFSCLTGEMLEELLRGERPVIVALVRFLWNENQLFKERIRVLEAENRELRARLGRRSRAARPGTPQSR